MTWHEQSPGFVRSADGRFDLTYSHDKRAWVALDWERGGKYVAFTLDKAKAWCGEQTQVKGKERVA